MTLKKYYNDDAWEVLEDYFDKIRDSLFKVNIKGEERQQVISDLRSHVQLKADETIEKNGIVSYNDVLEIMAELGSPQEITGSYGLEDDERTVTPRKKPVSLKKSISSKIPIKPATIGDESTVIATISSASRDYLAKTAGMATANRTAFMKLMIMTWRSFQVIIFSFPWFLLVGVIQTFKQFNIDSFYGNRDSIIFWLHDGSFTAFLQYQSMSFFFIVFLYLVFIVVELAVIRSMITSRLGDFSAHQRVTLLVYRYGLFSTLVLLVTYFSAIYTIFSFYMAILIIVLLLIERTIDSNLARYMTWRIKNGLHAYLDGNSKDIFRSIFSLLLVTVLIYMGLVIVLSIQLMNYIFYIRVEANMPGLYLAAIIGFIYTSIILFLVLWLNNDKGVLKAHSMEINAVIWAFRWFLLVTLIIATYASSLPPNIFAWFLWMVIFVLPLLLLEKVFIKMTRKLTGIDHSSVIDTIKSFIDSKLLLIVDSTSVPQSSDESVEVQPVTRIDKSRGEFADEIKKKPSTLNSGISEQFQVQKSFRGPEIDFEKLKFWKGSTILAFFRDIIFIYIKITFVVVFSVFIVLMANYTEYTTPSLDIIVVAICYTTLVFLMSSYKLYSFSRRYDRSNPYFYWLLTVISWLMMLVIPRFVELLTIYSSFYRNITFGESLIILSLIASPFILIQLNSSKNIIFITNKETNENSVKTFRNKKNDDLLPTKRTV
ncbi:MAG: hypothetical protein ACXAEU_21880 [Candidatus Hodarchaeales archaeon]|jgi:hypothetical protein